MEKKFVANKALIVNSDGVEIIAAYKRSAGIM